MEVKVQTDPALWDTVQETEDMAVMVTDATVDQLEAMGFRERWPTVTSLVPAIRREAYHNFLEIFTRKKCVRFGGLNILYTFSNT